MYQLFNSSMYPVNAHHPSAVEIILRAGSDIAGVLGELPDGVIEQMALPERVTEVQATVKDVIFHLANREDRLRRDTSMYPWFITSARAVVKNPDKLLPGKKPRTYEIIGRVDSPSAHPTLAYMSLILKYVPSVPPSDTPEIWLVTLFPHSKGP